MLMYFIACQTIALFSNGFICPFFLKKGKKKVDKSKVSRNVKEAGFCLKILTYRAKSTVFPRKRGGKNKKKGENNQDSCI